MTKHYPKPPEAVWLEQWPDETDTPDNVHYEKTGYGIDMRTKYTSRITKYVRETATIAEQQARLDAIAGIMAHTIDVRRAVGCVIEGGVAYDFPARKRALEVLARGTPRRECVRLTKKYRKEKL